MKAVAIVLISVALASCSSFAPKLEQPNLSVVNVEMVKSDIFEQRLKVRMRVQNPNDRELPVKGISSVMTVNGEDFAKGVAADSFVVPAFGEAEFDMILTANMAGAFVRLMTASRDKPPEALDYRIKGKVSLSSGLLRSIPFEESGSFKLR